MDERVKLIARLLDGETMSGLCREFGVSRKTGYKIYERYRDCGVKGRGVPTPIGARYSLKSRIHRGARTGAD
jgi:transposase